MGMQIEVIILCWFFSTNCLFHIVISYIVVIILALRTDGFNETFLKFREDLGFVLWKVKISFIEFFVGKEKNLRETHLTDGRKISDQLNILWKEWTTIQVIM